MTKQDFIIFLEDLKNDFIENPKSWENKTLEDFLDAMFRYTEDIDGYYKIQIKKLILKKLISKFFQIF